MRGMLFVGLLLIAPIAHADQPDEVCVLLTQCDETPGAVRAKCIKGYGATTGDLKKCQKQADALLPDGVKAVRDRVRPGLRKGQQQ